MRPIARRAHAGVVFTVDGVLTLVIHGGRTRSGELLSDVWAAPLSDDKHVQWWLKRDIPDASADAADIDASKADVSEKDVEGRVIDSSNGEGALSKKHHKKSRKNYPARRKGHLAVALPESPHDPLMVTPLLSDLICFCQKRKVISL